MCMRIALLLVLLGVSARADAQTWAELASTDRDAPVRVYEVGRRGWAFVDGKFLVVKDDELTVLRADRSLVIPKAEIARVERRWNDRVWNGALIGTLVGAVMFQRGAGQGCSGPGPGCTIGVVGSYAAIGALIDWSITGKKTVYRAP